MAILVNIFIFIGVLIISYFIFWKFIFLRDPKRDIPKGKNIVSPADGRILEVLNIKNKKEITIHKKYFGKIQTLCSDVGEDSIIISIFMSPLNVHINRVPIDGKVLSVEHKPGKLLAVNTLKAGLENEKSEVLLNTKIGKIKFIQVAGFLARSIENRLKIGQEVKKGERYGLINLGSQLIVILPKNKIKIKVKKGDKLKAGESILAEFN